MKVIKPFFLGVLGGLGLALVLVVGLFFSPLRETLYFAADPEMADIRSKLDQYQQWLAQTDLRIAEHGANIGDGAAVSDSLRAAETKAWRDYKGWRNRLGELARLYAHPSAEGFWPWAFSLRFWIPPFSLCLALLPGLFFAWRGRNRFRPGRVKPANKTARAQALSNFEDAIKKVARISEKGAGKDPEKDPQRDREPESDFGSGFSPRPAAGREPPTEAMSASAFLGSPAVDARPQPPEAEPSRDAGSETHFMQVGPGWGESLNPPGERIGAPGPHVPNPGGLSMEDEDVADARAAARAAAEDGDGEETLGAMPPTTEVERVERRKEDVLKLARKGMTSSEISRRMRISQDQVEFIIRLRREKG